MDMTKVDDLVKYVSSEADMTSLTSGRGFQDSTMVQVILDEDGSQYHIQRVILCEASPYFKAALTKGFAETESKILRMPGCSAEVFNTILYWITKQELPTLPDGAYESSDFQLWMVRTWLVAREYLMPRLQNMVMRQLFDCEVGLPPTEEALELVFGEEYGDSVMKDALMSEFVDSVNFPRGIQDQYYDWDRLGKIKGFTVKLFRTMTTKSDPISPHSPPGQSTEEVMRWMVAS